jgi:hypothetical protein
VLREFSWDYGYVISSAGEQTRCLRDMGGGDLGARRAGATGITTAGKIWGQGEAGRGDGDCGLGAGRGEPERGDCCDVGGGVMKPWWTPSLRLYRVVVDLCALSPYLFCWSTLSFRSNSIIQIH